MSGDLLTVLTSRGPRLTKLWKADGSIEPYDSAKWFTWEQRLVESVVDLSDLLEELESQPNSCIIRGQPKPDAPTPIRRLREGFDDVPLHTILIEIDNFKPLVSDPLDGEEAALEYISTCLPTTFHDVSFHWQLSASAGAPGKAGQLRAHCWMWLETPYDSATLKAWAKAENLPLDHSVFQTVQPHFTGAPVLEDGVTCPVARRSGFYAGRHKAVPLAIDTESLSLRVQGARQRGERLEVDDPLADYLEDCWEVWGTLTDGGMLVSCPWDDEHSGGVKGDTSSAYFPKGTNGHAEGAYVCMHNACDSRGRSEFAKAVGYTDNLLADLAVTEEPRGLTRSLNGAVLHDPLICPPWKRNGAGGILTNITNAVMGLKRSDVSGYELRYDAFKDGVVCAPEGCSTWRAFTDVDYTALRIALEAAGLEGIGVEMIRNAVLAVSMENMFDTAKDWLGGLRWDGIPRIETFWIEHFGVLDDPRGYARAVGLYAWTALAGRVLSPGIQADMAPILVGRQGLRKSRGVEAMSPSGFYTKMGFDENEVERARKMRGKLLIELDELKGLKSRDAEAILSWMTRSEEHWTPKFLEMTTTFKRRFLAIATTNDDDILDNPHGERRWLPLAVGKQPGFGKVDTSAIVNMRDLLWAEAAARFEKEGILWEAAEKLARGEHEQYKADDMWAHSVRKWMSAPDMSGETPRDRKHLTVGDVAEGALALAARSVKYADQRRIAKILRDEGYENVVRRVDGRNMKVWTPVSFV